MPPKAIEEAPSLPPTSVDFTAMHDAIRAGKSAEEALVAAGVAVPAPEPESDVAPAPEPKE